MATNNNNDNNNNDYTGFDRKGLRRTLRLTLGRIRSCQDNFEAKGNPWTTTRLDEYRQRKLEAEFNRHRFEAYNGILSEKDKQRRLKRKDNEPWDFTTKDKPAYGHLDRPLTKEEARQLDDWIEQRLGHTREQRALPRQQRPKVDGKELSRQNKARKEPRSSRTPERLAEFKRKRKIANIIKEIKLLDDAHNFKDESKEIAINYGHFIMIIPRK
jgi:hypothetical protein